MTKVVENPEPAPIAFTEDVTAMADYVRSAEGREAIERGLTDVRQGRRLQLGDYGSFRYLNQHQADPNMMLDVDQVIVGYNKTRDYLNVEIRQKRGFQKPDVFEIGEKIICIQNSREIGIFNGMIGECRSYSPMVYDGEHCLINFFAMSLITTI